MKELFKELSKDSDALHRVMATILEPGELTKTLIYGYEIKYCSGNEQFFQNNLDEIVDVRTTGVYTIGGREVYCEVLEETPELVVCGGGYVAAACIRTASTLDMHITCIEDREDFAETARRMGADEVICGNYAAELEKIKGGDNVFFLCMTRAHAFDEVCLEQILTAADRHGTLVTVIGPEAEAQIGNISVSMQVPCLTGDANDRCVFALVSVGEFDLLVTGDAPKAAEQTYLRQKDLPPVELLIAGHHGSKYSTSQELIRACRGADAVISSGYNTFGHPSEEALLALSALHSVHRTDQEGTVQFFYRKE